MRADELHPHGTYANLKLDDASHGKLEALQRRLGLANPTPRDKFHTTIIYSRKPCPGAMELHGMATPYPAWIKSLKTWPTQDGNRCLVAEVQAYTLDELHDHMLEKYGATHDYDEFTPHVTLSYDCGDEEMVIPEDLTDDDRIINYTVLEVKALDPDWRA